MSREKKFNTKNSAEFKIAVIMDMRENRLSYRETERKYSIFKMSVKRWERIYLEEGAGRTNDRTSRKKEYGQTEKEAFE